MAEKKLRSSSAPDQVDRPGKDGEAENATSMTSSAGCRTAKATSPSRA